MSRYDPKPYELKIFELQGQIEAKAKELQNVNEAVDLSRQEIKSIAERKSLLQSQIDKFEKQLKDKEDILQKIIERKKTVIEYSTQKLIDNRESLKKAQIVLHKVTKDLKGLTRVSIELQEFITKNSKVQKEYSKITFKLNQTTAEYDKVSTKIKKEKAEVQKEKQELSELESNVQDLRGKLATYVGVAQKTLEYVNKHLEETGTPLKFQVPEINIDNFDKE